MIVNTPDIINTYQSIVKRATKQYVMTSDIQNKNPLTYGYFKFEFLKIKHENDMLSYHSK